MTLFRSLGQRLNRLREMARREFLRDPDVVLFERGSDSAPVLARKGGDGR